MSYSVILTNQRIMISPVLKIKYLTYLSRTELFIRLFSDFSTRFHFQTPKLGVQTRLVAGCQYQIDPRNYARRILVLQFLSRYLHLKYFTITRVAAV